MAILSKLKWQLCCNDIARLNYCEILSHHYQHDCHYNHRVTSSPINPLTAGAAYIRVFTFY